MPHGLITWCSNLGRLNVYNNSMWKFIRKIPYQSRFKVMIHTNTSVTSIKSDFEQLMKHSVAPIKDIDARQFCYKFKELNVSQKEEIISFIAAKHNIKFDDIRKHAESFLNTSNNEDKLLVAERLKHSLSPEYQNVFSVIIKLERGIKFLVDLRSITQDLMRKLDSHNSLYLPIKLMNTELKNLLAFAFSVGFLSLQRITWDSSCRMLQKISEYEAVHPVKNLADIKQRVGPYRRCYVLTHSSMLEEPIVVLHTALTEDISSSIRSIVKPKNEESILFGKEKEEEESFEDPALIHAAVFYSITSTQKGLHGIELGNKLIKMVAGEILKEFPHIRQMSSLSPIPGFRDWLLVELNKIKEGQSILPTLLTHSEISSICNALNVDETESMWNLFGRQIASNYWMDKVSLREVLKQPLLKLCAHYLYQEKHRSYALNSVAHFHLRNGAVMWRINWAADLSPRGINSSCGIMVNYRYFMEETYTNSERYVKERVIKISKDVEDLLPHLQTKL